jgi:hypothetical protein
MSHADIGRKLGVPRSSLSSILKVKDKVLDEIKRTTGWKAGFWFPAEATDFCLLHSVQTASGTHPASWPMGTGDSFPGIKAAAAGAWSWPLTSI